MRCKNTLIVAALLTSLIGCSRRNQDGAINDPNSAIAYYNRGVAWSKKGEFDKAVNDYDEAIRLDPKFAKANTKRGLAWESKGEFDKADKDFAEADRLNKK